MRRLFGVALALVATIAVAAEIAPEARRSGYGFASAETRVMQDDDTANPGMLWVSQGEGLWTKKAGAAGLSCRDCHGDAQASMSNVAARYPAFDAALGRPIDLEQRINLCRTEHQRAEPLTWESEDLLALTGFVAHQSRGLPIAVDDNPELNDRSTRGALRIRRAGRRRAGALSDGARPWHDDRNPGGAPLIKRGPVLFVRVVVLIGEGRDDGADLGDRVMLDL